MTDDAAHEKQRSRTRLAWLAQATGIRPWQVRWQTAEVVTGSEPVVYIRPPSRWAAVRPAEMWRYRDVLVMLAVRDIKLRYRQTILGVLWVVLQPLVAGLIFAAVFGAFARLPSDGNPYLLFVFSGMICWNLFASVLTRSGNSLVAEARLVTKVYFPRLLIPLAGSVSALVDFLVSGAVLAGLLVWHRIWPGTNLLLIPGALVLVLVLAIGVSFWVSALNVRYRDFAHALPFIVQVWMYASPVVYATQLVPERWRGWLILNPMCGVLELFRSGSIGSEMSTGSLVLGSASWALIIFATGVMYFQRVQSDLADAL